MIFVSTWSFVLSVNPLFLLLWHVIFYEATFSFLLVGSFSFSDTSHFSSIKVRFLWSINYNDGRRTKIIEFILLDEVKYIVWDSLSEQKSAPLLRECDKCRWFVHMQVHRQDLDDFCIKSPCPVYFAWCSLLVLI